MFLLLGGVDSGVQSLERLRQPEELQAGAAQIHLGAAAAHTEGPDEARRS